MKNKIIDYLTLLIKEKYSLDLKEKIKLETPPKKQFWDFAFGCFVLSKDLKKSPDVISEELSLCIEKNDIIENSNHIWAYLNLKINNIAFIKQNLDYFYNFAEKKLIQDNRNRIIFIDYIWANVWKPLHIGHMCTSNQGQVLVNLYRKLGFKVVSDSHIGDWGIIFGKLITAYKLFWDEKKLKEDAVNHLFELYVKISEKSKENKYLEKDFRKEFKLLSQGDKNSIKMWESFTLYSIKSMQTQLDRLNIKPDYNIWESFYEGINLPKIENYPDLKYDMKSIVSELIKKWIATKNKDSSVWIEFNEKLKIPSCILQKRDLTHWYLASDLASVKYRVENWNLEKIVYFVDKRQELHLKQVFEISNRAWWLKKIGWQKKNIELFHAHNWFISLKDWVMKSREWKIIKLLDLLDESRERAKKIILEKRNDIKWKELQNLSEIIWIWAIKYGYLKKSRETDVIFDWDEFMSFEGNSWPYIQYTYVRARKILKDSSYKIKIDEIKNISQIKEETILLFKKLLNYDETLIETANRFMPHILCKYIYELTKDFNSFYNNIPILKEQNEGLKNLNLLLTKNCTQVLRESFEILWIQMPEQM